MSTHIYLHRANSQEQIEAAIRSGYGVEVDIRTHDGESYLCHDPIRERDVDRLFWLPQFMWLVVVLGGRAILDYKETGIAAGTWTSPLTKTLMEQYGEENVLGRFVSTDLIVPDQLALARVGARSLSRSSRWERIESEEFGGTWLDYVLDESQLPDEVGEGVFLVSPELHTKKPPSESFARRVMSMGFEGVCTDHPELYSAFS